MRAQREHLGPRGWRGALPPAPPPPAPIEADGDTTSTPAALAADLQGDFAEAQELLGKERNFGEMTKIQRASVRLLGWTKESWDEGEDDAPYQREWTSLSESEKRAAGNLGMDAQDFGPLEDMPEEY